MFRNLPRLEKPWRIMLVAMLFFALLEAADIMRTVGIGSEHDAGLVHDLAGMVFAVLLGYSLYLFKRSWTVPKT
jgi:hypothetical protein